MRRGFSSHEWDELPLRDQEAVAWWQWVEATGYRPMTKAEWNAIPVKGGARGEALRKHEAARAALLPPDEPED